MSASNTQLKADYLQIVADEEASSSFTTWRRQNPGEYTAWVAFNAAIVGGAAPASPRLATAYGRGLADAARLYLDAVTAPVTPPPPPPPPPPPAATWGWDAPTLGTVDAAGGSALAGYAGPPGYLFGALGVAYAKAGDPTYTIHAGNLDPSIRIPHGTQPGMSTDGPLAVVDQAAGREHSLWHAQYSASTDTWTAGGGSSVPIGATNEAQSGKNNDSSNAARIPIMRGVVTPQDIIDGVIKHTLRMRINEPQIGPAPCPYPANTRFGGAGAAGHATFGFMYAGGSGSAAALAALPKVEKILATAIIAYGIVLTDGGAEISIDATDPVNGGPTWQDAGLGYSNGVVKALDPAMTAFWKSLRRVGPVPVLTP